MRLGPRSIVRSPRRLIAPVPWLPTGGHRSAQRRAKSGSRSLRHLFGGPRPPARRRAENGFRRSSARRRKPLPGGRLCRAPLPPPATSPLMRCAAPRSLRATARRALSLRRSAISSALSIAGRAAATLPLISSSSARFPSMIPSKSISPRSFAMSSARSYALRASAWRPSFAWMMPSCSTPNTPAAGRSAPRRCGAPPDSAPSPPRDCRECRPSRRGSAGSCRPGAARCTIRLP